jgi:hypothetical protein
VHRKVLEKHLADLHIPARDRFIEFDGDEESIGYLLEFLYTGDYAREAAAEFQEPKQPSQQEAETTATTPPEEPIHPIILAARTSTLGVWGKPAALHTKFHHGKPASKPRRITPTAVITNGIASPPASPSTHKEHQTAGTASAFLVHAKVYLLAERYGASGLKLLSLEKLRAALKALELDPPVDRTATLIEFIKKIYSLPASNEGHLRETGSKLRDVVVAHAVAYLPQLQADPEFNAYIREGGDFVADLFTALASVRRTHH